MPLVNMKVLIQSGIRIVIVIDGTYLNCLKSTACLDFQLHFQNCISKNSFMESDDETIIFINIYDLCKNMMN